LTIVLLLDGGRRLRELFQRSPVLPPERSTVRKLVDRGGQAADQLDHRGVLGPDPVGVLKRRDRPLDGVALLVAHQARSVAGVRLILAIAAIRPDTRPTLWVRQEARRLDISSRRCGASRTGTMWSAVVAGVVHPGL
jgi:hypothetical protein